MSWRPEATDVRYAMTRRCGWQPHPYFRLCRGRGWDCCWCTQDTGCSQCQEGKAQFIIGADFLAAHNCELSLRHKIFTMGGDSVECIPERARASHDRLKLAQWVELPPHTEVLVNCKETQSIKHFGRTCAVAKPANDSCGMLRMA